MVLMTDTQSDYDLLSQRPPIRKETVSKDHRIRREIIDEVFETAVPAGGSDGRWKRATLALMLDNEKV